MPCTDNACVNAFGAFAGAAAAHFAGHGIIFECTNEPNGMGRANTTLIAEICLAAGTQVRGVGELWVGPTTAGIDLPYLKAAFANGILSGPGGFSQVSVHPYRSEAPEDVLADYAALRALISNYSTEPLQINAGEWGYTSALPPCVYGNKRDRILQGKFVPRMWLVNTLGAVNVSILYDFRDDGNNATNCESNFGSVFDSPTGNASQPFPPKPAFRAALAAQTGVGNAAGFSARVTPTSIVPGGFAAAPEDVFILQFSDGSVPGGFTFAAWTNATLDSCNVTQARVDCGFDGITEDACLARGCCFSELAPPPGEPQCFTGLAPLAVTFVAPRPEICLGVVDVFGYSRGNVCSLPSGLLTINVTDGPAYLLAPQPEAAT